MSVQRAVWLYCDVEGCERPSDLNMGGSGETVREARSYATRIGWHRTRDGRDICEFCWDEGER